MFRIAEIELQWKIRSESCSKPMSEFRALFFTFALFVIIMNSVVMVMVVFLGFVCWLVSC